MPVNIYKHALSFTGKDNSELLHMHKGRPLSNLF